MKSFSRLLEKFDIFGSKHSGIYIEILGRDLLFAEGYCRIDEYTENIITLTSNKHTVRVLGNSLRLRHLSKERIAVEGRIDSFEFI